MEKMKISDKFKDLIDEKYRNNYIFNTTTQNSDCLLYTSRCV